MHLNYPTLYVALALGWMTIETNLSIARIEANDKHWVSRSMRWLRDWGKRHSRPVSVGGRVLAAFGLAILAWIPILLASFCWPVTVTIYVLSKLRDKD
ncbi:hypothetical protein CTA21_16365 [Salmonella enterica]|nr:hypothetical protein [Salmonella enterica]